jgi:hypothetical protein
MSRVSPIAHALALTTACLALLLAGLVVASDAPAASSGADQSSSIAKKKKKKKCKVTQKRNSKGKCVKKKCKKGYKLTKKGKCKKSASSPGGPKGNPVIDHSDVDGDGIGLTRETALGSSPSRKDIFVQLNFTSETVRASIPCSELDKLVNVFATAPVGNPNGTNGIDLHLDAGMTCASRSYNLGGSVIYAAANPSCPDFNDALNNGQAKPADRDHVFHVASVTITCGHGGEGGVADNPGAKIVVFTDGSGFAMTFMHELGHNLGLGHGADGPNRRSVMHGRMFSSPTGSSSDSVDFIDFQRYALPALDENNLSESAGVGLPAEAQTMYVNYHCGTSGTRTAWLGFSNGAIDWNCSSASFFDPPDITGGMVSADINGDGQLTVLPATPTEWDTLVFNGGGVIVP